MFRKAWLLCPYPKRGSHIPLWLILLSCVLLLACSSRPPINKPQAQALDGASAPDDPKAVPRQQQKARDVDALNEQLMARAQTQVNPGDSLLGAGDLLNIEIFEAKELNTKARISSRGFVTLPLLGQLKVDGLTAREAETRIEELYREKYIKDPHVSIFVEEHFSQRVNLVGEFKNPGTHDMVSKQRLLDVMALGGGLTEFAGRVAQIRRGPGTIKPDGDGGQEVKDVVYVDLEDLLEGGKGEFNVEIKGGDTIFVGRMGEYFLDGAVRRPGAFSLRKKMSLQEAIVAAGGMAPWADDDDVTVVRVEAGERKMYTIEMSKLENWGFPVQDQDVVVVGSNGLLRIWYGFSLGFMGTGYRDPGSR